MSSWSWEWCRAGCSGCSRGHSAGIRGWVLSQKPDTHRPAALPLQQGVGRGKTLGEHPRVTRQNLLGMAPAGWELPLAQGSPGAQRWLARERPAGRFPAIITVNWGVGRHQTQQRGPSAALRPRRVLRGLGFHLQGSALSHSSTRRRNGRAESWEEQGAPQPQTRPGSSTRGVWGSGLGSAPNWNLLERLQGWLGQQTGPGAVPCAPGPVSLCSPRQAAARRRQRDYPIPSHDTIPSSYPIPSH